MKELIERKISRKTSVGQNNILDHDLNQLLNKIEKGKIPLRLLTNYTLQMVINLNRKIDELDEKLKLLPQLADINRQIEEIHKLHFATKHLQKNSSLKDKYLADILIGNLKKRN